MKIGMFLNNSHSIDGRVMKECKTLTEAGHEVIVIAKKNKALPDEESIGGAKVLRVIEWPKYSLMIIKQFIYSINWIKRGLEIDVDVYHAHDADTLLEAAICSIIKKKKLVYDSHELFLNIATLEKKKIARFFWWLKERFGIKHANLVMAANQERLEIMKKRYPFIKKSEVIENFPDLELGQIKDYDEVRRNKREELRVAKEKIVFVFQGALNRMRGLEILLSSLAYSKHASEAVFLIIGNGDYKETFEKEIKQKNFANFIFTGKVSYLDLPSFMAASDIGIIFFPPICLNYIYPAPNKLYEYMINRLAILANNAAPIMRVINEEKNGYYAKESSAKELGSLIDMFILEKQEVIAEMKKKSYQAALSKYNWQKQEKKLKAIYADAKNL